MIDRNGDNDGDRFRKKQKATRAPAAPPSPPLTSSASSSTAPTKAFVHDHGVAQQASEQTMHATFSPIDFAEGGWHDGIPEEGTADATSQERDRTVSPVSAFGFAAKEEVDQDLDNIVAFAANMTERQQIVYLMALSGDGGNVGDGKGEEAAAQKVQAGGGMIVGSSSGSSSSSRSRSRSRSRSSGSSSRSVTPTPTPTPSISSSSSSSSSGGVGGFGGGGTNGKSANGSSSLTGSGAEASSSITRRGDKVRVDFGEEGICDCVVFKVTPHFIGVRDQLTASYTWSENIRIRDWELGRLVSVVERVGGGGGVVVGGGLEEESEDVSEWL